MPLFFYISGMSLTFVNPSKTTYLSFMKNKAKRLIIPFILACITLLIPRLYLSQEYEPWTRVNGEIENNFFIYLIKTIPTIHSKLSWLWFLPVLFIIMILNYPMIIYSYRRKHKIPLSLHTDG